MRMTLDVQIHETRSHEAALRMLVVLENIRLKTKRYLATGSLTIKEYPAHDLHNIHPIIMVYMHGLEAFQIFMLNFENPRSYPSVS